MAHIPISTTATRVSYSATSSQTAFTIPFEYFDETDIKVYQQGTLLTLTTHYTTTPNTTYTGGFAGGTVTLETGATLNDVVVIVLDMVAERLTDFPTSGAFNINTLNTWIDKMIVLFKQSFENISRKIGRPATSTESYSLDWPDGATTTSQQVFVDSANGISFSASSGAVWAAGNGTESLPYYTWSSDLNSGLYRIGSDNIGLSLGGTKRVDFGAATTAFTGEVTATGFTGTLDGSLGSGTPAAAVVTQLTSGGDILSDTDSTDSLGSTGVRWLKTWTDSIQTTANIDVGADLIVAGNLTVNGTTVTNSVTNQVIADPLIELNNGAGSNANDLGIVMERGSTGNNAFMGWDESADKFAFGTTTATGASTGNISYADAQVLAEGATFSGTSPNLGTVTTVDINGGTVDGATIGASSQTTGQFTNLTGTVVTASTSLALASGATITGINDTDAFSDASATTAATSESIKAYVDTSAKAAGLQMTWESTTTDTDQGVGKVWANNATLSSATVLYFDDVEKNGVSINAFIDSLDDPTATNSATIYISEGGTGEAGVVFQVSGAVTSASTYSKVAVTHVATYGTLADADLIGVVIAFSGNNGSINNIVEDTSPQLGGDLDVNGKFINGNLISDTDSTDSFGSTGVRWLKGWFDTLTAGTLTIGAGSITDSSGAIDFGNENLVTTGTLGGGAGTVTSLDAGSGTIKTTGTMELGHATDTTIARVSAGVISVEGDTVPLLATAQTFSKAQSGSITAITSSSNSIATDMALNNHFSHTFTEDTTLANPTNIVAGTSGSFFLTQHASSPKTLAFGSYFDFAAGTAPTVTATNSAVDRIDYIARTTTSLHCVWTGTLS